MTPITYNDNKIKINGIVSLEEIALGLFVHKIIHLKGIKLDKFKSLINNEDFGLDDFEIFFNKILELLS